MKAAVVEMMEVMMVRKVYSNDGGDDGGNKATRDDDDDDGRVTYIHSVIALLKSVHKKPRAYASMGVASFVDVCMSSTVQYSTVVGHQHYNGLTSLYTVKPLCYIHTGQREATLVL